MPSFVVGYGIRSETICNKRCYVLPALVAQRSRRLSQTLFKKLSEVLIFPEFVLSAILQCNETRLKLNGELYEAICTLVGYDGSNQLPKQITYKRRSAENSPCR